MLNKSFKLLEKRNKLKEFRRGKILFMINERTDFLIRFDDFLVNRHKNSLVYFKELSYILINHCFALLIMVNVRLYETVITYQALMLPAKFRGYLFRMNITKY